jgi:cell division protein FtsW (lipid II flippase)
MHLVLYAFINAGVVTMLLPTTGLPMPFLSYGGSSLISVGFTVGILINISRNIDQPAMDDRLQQFRDNKRKFYNMVVSNR